MTNENKNTSKQIVKDELIELYDEFVNLNEACCFLLDAGAVMRLSGHMFDETSVGGYRQCSEVLKGRMAEFKVRLKIAYYGVKTCRSDIDG